MICGIDSTNIEFFNSCLYAYEENVIDKKGRAKVSKDYVKFAKACSSAGDFVTSQKFEVDDSRSDLPSMALFGSLIYSSQDSQEEPYSGLVPCSFFSIGPTSDYPSLDDQFKVSDFRESRKYVTLSLYYYPDYGKLDLSPYVAYAFKLQATMMFIELRLMNAKPFVLPIDLTVVREYSRNQVESPPAVDGKIQENSLNEFLASSCHSDRYKKVSVRVDDSLVSVLVKPYSRGFAGMKVTCSKGVLGSVNGYWILADYTHFKLRFFLFEVQFALGAPGDWVFALVETLLRGRYITTPIDDSHDFGIGTTVISVGVTALEACHCANTWRCDHHSTFKVFRSRTLGKSRIDLDPTLEDYKDSYTETPYLPLRMRTTYVDPITYPCGVCPTGGQGNGRLKRHYLGRVKAIHAFNYGVVGLSSRLEPALGGLYFVTQSSYGVKLAKYQSIYLLPSVISKLPTTPNLCACTFGEACDECVETATLAGSSFVSHLVGRAKYDWNDSFNLYIYNGKPYVICSLQTDPLRGGHSILDGKVNFKMKYLRLQKAKVMIADLYHDYVLLRRAKFYRHPLGSVYYRQGSSLFSEGITDVDIDMRFFGVLSMIKSSPPRATFRHAWYLVQDYYSNCLSFSYDPQRGIRELLDILNLLDEFGQYGETLSLSQVMALKGNLIEI